MITFVEFLAQRESIVSEQDYPHWLDHWRSVLPPNLHGAHNGDCTDQPQTCVFCWLEDELRSYRIQVMSVRAIDYIFKADGNLTAGELRQQVREKFGADVDAELAKQFGNQQ